MTWTLHLGECLEGMRALGDRSVDHVLTDPPYSERVHRRLGNEGRSDGARARQSLTFSCLTTELAQAVALEVCRIARRWILVFCDEISFGVWVEALEAAGGEYVRKGTWVKTDAMPQMSGDRPSTGTEEIVIAHAPRPNGGRLRWNGGGRKAVYEGRAQEPGITRIHPAQKPLWLMEALVRDFTDPGELIADPFAGGATSLVAAARLGRRGVGWELNPATHAEALLRLSGAPKSHDSQLALFGGGGGGAA